MLTVRLDGDGSRSPEVAMTIPDKCPHCGYPRQPYEFARHIENCGSALPARQLVDQLEKLIEKWRAKAQRDSKRQYNHLEWQAVAVEVAHCADELETIALAALLDPAPPETNEEDLSRRDRTGEPVVSSPPHRPNGDK